MGFGLGAGVFFSSLTLVTACSDGSRSSAMRSPTAPSSVLPYPGQAAVRVVDAVLRPFPGRQDAFRFRTQDLEQRYRAMGRSRVQTFVDPEGSVIWVGEYLRYRAGECTHSQAFDRIRIQINGGGVPAPCGQNEQSFPPRNEALTFRRELEAVYQTRGAGLADTVVDDEGDVIWTMEYYRYVLSGCSHADAIAKIMTQISGGGVPADCGGPVVQPLVVSFSVRNTPCIAPSTGPVSCQFAVALTGGLPPYSYEWQFRSPNNALVPEEGTVVSPVLGCGFQAGLVQFNVGVTLTVRQSGGSPVTVTGNQLVTRAAGACGT
jgi:hypothetical protein